MGMFVNIVLIIFAIIFFLFIVLVHELGHFVVARLSGIRVNEFAIGMGPRIFGFKKGETQYSFKLLPIGGFCAMEGEENESEDKDSFSKKGVCARIATVSAGAIMNIILGFILSFILTVQMSNFTTTKIKEFEKNAVSNSSGLKAGDTIKFFNGYKIDTPRDISFASMSSDVSPKNLEIVVIRDNQEVVLKDVKFPVEKIEGKEYIKCDFLLETVPKNFFNVFAKSYKDTVSSIKIVWGSILKLVKGKFDIKEVSGPVGIASGLNKVTSDGLKISFLSALNNIIFFMMMITVNLGVFNLLPFPALDGGRLLFLFVEVITRKPIPAKYEGLIHTIGFVCLMLAMLFFTFFDFIKIFGGSG